MKSVSEWLQLNAVLLGTDSAPHPRTVVFLRTLASLCAVDQPDTVSLTIWWTGLAGKPETVVLNHSPGQS